MQTSKNVGWDEMRSFVDAKDETKYNVKGAEKEFLDQFLQLLYEKEWHEKCIVLYLDTTKHLVQKIRQPFMVKIHLYHLAQIGIH